ncbi:YciI family protein [Myxococcaceae bacterium GXIMD 01537]
MTRSPSRLSTLLLAALLGSPLLPGAARAEDKPAAAPKAAPAAPRMEFEKHYLVILVRGPAWTPEKTPETERIQEQHLAHLRRMGESGKMVIAGPFGEQQDAAYRGMCLYRTQTLEEARKLAEEDPAVKSGRLKVEVMAWYTEKGYMTFPKAPAAK